MEEAVQEVLKQVPRPEWIPETIWESFARLNIYWSVYPYPEEEAAKYPWAHRFYNTCPPDDTLVPFTPYFSSVNTSYLPMSSVRLPGLPCVATQLPIHPLWAWAGIVCSGARVAVSLVEPESASLCNYRSPSGSCHLGSVDGKSVEIVFKSLRKCPLAAPRLPSFDSRICTYVVNVDGKELRRSVVALVHFHQWPDYSAVSLDIISALADYLHQVERFVAGLEAPAQRMQDQSGMDKVIGELTDITERRCYLIDKNDPPPIPQEIQPELERLCEATACYIARIVALSPQDEAALHEALRGTLQARASLFYIHCRAGIGRTGTLISCLFYSIIRSIIKSFVTKENSHDIGERLLNINIGSQHLRSLSPSTVVQIVRRYRGRYAVQRIEQYYLICSFFKKYFSESARDTETAFPSSPSLLPHSPDMPLSTEYGVWNTISCMADLSAFKTQP